MAGQRGFGEMVAENVARSFAGKAGDELSCRACGAGFVRGDWCFHQLCDGCFRRFDVAKMDGRCGTGPVCEDVEAWVRSAFPGA